MDPQESATILDRTEQLRHLIAHLGHLLPAQGPIGIFVHHNTLHAFQHLPFDEAVVKAGELFGKNAYLSEAAYRAALQSGRIQYADIFEVLNAEPNEAIGDHVCLLSFLRKRMLVPGVRAIDAGNVEWMLGDGQLEPVEMLTLFERRASAGGTKTRQKPERPKDGVLAEYGLDLDEIIHPLLIRWTAAYLDQGLAYWSMPNRELGFLNAVKVLMRQPGGVFSEHLTGLRQAFERADGDAAEVVLKAATELGVSEADLEVFLRAELLALPGWAGMMSQLELQPGLAPHDLVPFSLMEFLAVRLTLTLAAVKSVAGDAKAWRVELQTNARTTQLVMAAQLCEAALACGFSMQKVQSWSDADFEAFHREVMRFDSLERRRVLHLAYERRHERQILLPLGQHRRRIGLVSPQAQVSAQVFFCIDEREESLRRHLEEVDASIETVGVAGFFGVAMSYLGLDAASGSALCPVVVTPRHAVVEKPHEEDRDLHAERSSRRKLWSSVAWNLFVSSRTLVGGWFITVVLGVFSIFPLITRVLAPRQYSILLRWLNGHFLPKPRTELQYVRENEHVCEQGEDGLFQGFSREEKINCVASVLYPAGMHEGFARLVLILGHGSTTINNPHESAYRCGACGGFSGGPNARSFASMANRPEVREGLKERGIHIGEDTFFVGGIHDTTSDDIEFFDVEHVPATHRAELERLRYSLDEARERNALERMRRFHPAEAFPTALAALHHVEERSSNMAEPRPEYGHGTNAVCVVGRRGLTRGLFLDRRSFLVSYDPTLDESGESLSRVLNTVVPVCGGISLEYYFSTVDNEGYGCGTKLPHNVSALLGVMNGFEGDLRTGLPQQTVELHEPVRILFVVEARPGRLKACIEGSPLLREFVDNEWIRIACVDPEHGSVEIYRKGEFESVDGDDERLGSALTSADWYRGHKKHLGIAHIGRTAA